MVAEGIRSEEIRTKIKQIVSNVTNLPIEEIADDASYREDLNLDSLSLLEIGVDVGYEFRLEIPEEELGDVETIDDAVHLVLQHLKQRGATAKVA